MRHFIVTLILAPLLFLAFWYDGGDRWWFSPMILSIWMLMTDVVAWATERTRNREFALRCETEFLDRFAYDKLQIERVLGEDNTTFRARISKPLTNSTLHRGGS